MASAAALPIRSVVSIAALAVGIVVSRMNVRAVLLNTVTGPGSTSRIVALLLIAANLKSLPFVWHYRIWINAFFRHIVLSSHRFNPTATGPRALGPAAIFQPVITSSRSPLYECDYNLHKSNSTYFADLDVTRSHMVCVLLRDGIDALKKNNKTQIVRTPDGGVAKGSFFMMLGGTMASFKQEIKPYASYEMWSRVLCWDRKWLYIVTHFVKTGAVKPEGYTLGAPGSGILGGLFGAGKKGKKPSRKGPPTVEQLTGPVDNKAIHASAISKYVMKVGRLTVHPEVVFAASGLLPPKPGGWATMSGTSTAPVEAETVANGAAVPEPNGSADAEELWDWKRVEAENARGLKLAEHFAALDGLHAEFTGENRPALGAYTDLFW